MKGFIVGTVIIILVIGTVIFTSAYAGAQLNELYDEVARCTDSEDYEKAREKFDGLTILLSAITPDELIRDAEAMFVECITAGEDLEVKKSRLLLTINELGRHAGVSPVSVL